MKTHDQIEQELEKLFDGPRGYWAEHPRHPLEDWRYEVANNDTRQGYRGWLYDRIANGEDD